LYMALMVFSNGFQRPHRIKDSRYVILASSKMASGEKFGIIIVDHGSRVKAANDMLDLVSSFNFCIDLNVELARVVFKVVLKYKSKFGGESIVEPAHMELSEPSISAAYRRCIEQGATSIICHPFFLSRGRHVQVDIPTLVQQAAEEFPSIAYRITEPLGTSDKIIDLIDESIESSLQRSNLE